MSFGTTSGTSCRSCRWLDVPLNKSGKRVIRRGQLYPCIVPIAPLPPLPLSVLYNKPYWPPTKSYMRPDEGLGCPLHESGTVARDGNEAQRGLNDTWPGDRL